MRQVLFIFIATVLGVLFPSAHRYTFLVQPFVMLMLFFTFLNIDFQGRILRRMHLKVLLANLLLPLVLFGLFYPFGYIYAVSAFLVAIAPTAAVAPVIAGFLGSDVALVTVSVILTSPVVALALPFLLPILLGPLAQLSVSKLIFPVLSLVFIPLILGQLIKRYLPLLHRGLTKEKSMAFYLFLGNIFIACANASHFIQTDKTTGLPTILLIAANTAVICLLHFWFGQHLGGNTFSVEASMALGRKNTMFSIWVALTFINPMAALGPIFYIFYQNLYNSWQIYRYAPPDSSNLI